MADTPTLGEGLTAGFGAISSLFGGFSSSSAASTEAKGSQAAGDAFTKAAAIEGVNIDLVEMSTRVQEQATERALVKKIGQQEAAFGGANISPDSTTGQALLRESTQQGHLTEQMIGLQGEIQKVSFEEQQAAIQGEAQQAYATAAAQRSAASSDIFGGILGAVGKAIPLLRGLF